MMNLDGCTPGQRASIQHLDGPLFVAAGAGSGKTFTLQQRIAYALLPESGPALGSIEEVLAITYTNKAAAEIKARVRAALRAEGMGAEALKVDSAWISTIHGMCTRILREHALELDIDPRFTVVEGADVDALRAVALNAVFKRDSECGIYQPLLKEYSVASSGFGSGIVDMVTAVTTVAKSYVDEFDAVQFRTFENDLSCALRGLLVAAEDALAHSEVKLAAKQGQRLIDANAQLTTAVDALRALFDRGASVDNAREVYADLPKLRKDAFGRGDADYEVTSAYNGALAQVGDAINAAISGPLGVLLLSLARETDAEYQRLLDETASIDNDGLLHRTYRLLADHPDIARSYQKRFKLVMVDEFQDTNQLQVDLITLVAGADRLCTVGDAQQSIYRFNGADVSVFERQRAVVQKQAENPVPDCAPALIARLDDNFRSHGDVLAFVRAVCAQDGVFGVRFLDLKASRAESGRYKGTIPRIELLANVHPHQNQKAALALKATRIAERFAQLRRDGHEPGEMVLLLGRMTNIDIYAQALRDAGFDCVFEGGGTFFGQPEVQAVGSLLETLANPYDTEALFSLLTGPFAQVSSQDLLAMATYYHPGAGAYRRRGLAKGLQRGGRVSGPDSEAEAAPADGVAPAAAHAFSVLARGRSRLKRMLPSQVVEACISESGWLDRLGQAGTEGVAAAANIYKALRMIEQFESGEGVGIAQVAGMFQRGLTGRDAPGSLSTDDQNAVHILTIHKSKGLEYPIVAVADYEPKKLSGGSLMCTKCGAFALAALEPGKGRCDVKGDESPIEVEDETSALEAIDQAYSASGYRAALTAYEQQCQNAEALRLMYVAATRASEYLLFTGDVFASKKDGFKAGYVFERVLSGLGIDVQALPEEGSEVPYGGSAPARFHISDATAVALVDGSTASEEAGDPAAAAVADSQPWIAPVLERFEPDTIVFNQPEGSDGVFSYSSIAPDDNHLPIEERDDRSAATASAAKQKARFNTEFDVSICSSTDDFVSEEELAYRSGGASPAATDIGTAFHRCAQLAVEQARVRAVCDGSAFELVKPDKERMSSIARTYLIGSEARPRLEWALARWFASDVAAEVLAFAAGAAGDVRAEVPFFVELGGTPADGANPVYLEGEIDLLATDAEAKSALVVDYKTGGAPRESAERLLRKHELQAKCYAYAVLSQGYDQVELRFVRVEQLDCNQPDQPQVVSYRFTQDALPALESAILDAQRRQ